MSYMYDFNIEEFPSLYQEDEFMETMDIGFGHIPSDMVEQNGAQLPETTFGEGLVSINPDAEEMHLDSSMLLKDPLVAESEIQPMLISSSTSDDSSASNMDTDSFGENESEPDPLLLSYQAKLNNDPRLTFNFADDPRSIPDLTQERMHKIPGIMSMYYDYQRAFSDPLVKKEDHMERARALAITMLEHVFPPSQGFIVEPVAQFPTVAGYGWSIELKPAHKNAPLKHRLISPEQITGFMVSKLFDMFDEDGTHFQKSFPHTYLTIIIDDLADFDHWQSDSASQNNRGDIMAYSMGVQAKIDKGYGIVLVGPQIEFYKYSNKASKPMLRFARDNWSFDMRTEPPSLVSQTLEAVAETAVCYQNGVVGGGSTRIVNH